MQTFAQLLDRLLYSPSRNRKLDLLTHYFQNTPDPDRGVGLAALTGDLHFPHLKASHLRKLIAGKVDPDLFKLSYDYVGDLAETIALMWPEDKWKHNQSRNDSEYTKHILPLPALGDLYHDLQKTDPPNVENVLSDLLSRGDTSERWALLKLVTGGLRVGVSARLAKVALARLGGKPVEDIEKLWHGLSYPYEPLFRWLEGRAAKPLVAHTAMFHPMMLAHPFDEERDPDILDPDHFIAEWKWDGIRAQLALNGADKRLFSRTGDDISSAFPDLLDGVSGVAVLDGELLVGEPAIGESAIGMTALEGSYTGLALKEKKTSQENRIGERFIPLPFNCLQQRLNRKTVQQKHLKPYPAFIRVYDMLFEGSRDIRDLPYRERRKRLYNFIKNFNNSARSATLEKGSASGKVRDIRIDLSDQIAFDRFETLDIIRQKGGDLLGREGVMLKRQDSSYQSGRPKGQWFKWKRDAKLVDAVILYAQRGHGRRSSYYSDFTFGVPVTGNAGANMVPIGKAYSGFTDKELEKLDHFVRRNTLNRFGPVREVEKKLVIEVAFDDMHSSPRHKSGIALRFPRFSRIRWDKPVSELEALPQLLERFMINPI